MIVKHYLYLSKLAAQMVTSTPSENLFYHRYELQNQNFDFETAKTWILHAWSIFLKRAHQTKLGSKKIFSMKTLSKLGALMEYLQQRSSIVQLFFKNLFFYKKVTHQVLFVLRSAVFNFIQGADNKLDQTL
jgi:hypothetical protein